MGKHLLHVWKCERIFPKRMEMCCLTVQAGQGSARQETCLYCTGSHKSQHRVTRLNLVNAYTLKAKWVLPVCFPYPYYEAGQAQHKVQVKRIEKKNSRQASHERLYTRLHAHGDIHHMTAGHSEPDMSVRCVITVCVRVATWKHISTRKCFTSFNTSCLPHLAKLQICISSYSTFTALWWWKTVRLNTHDLQEYWLCVPWHWRLVVSSNLVYIFESLWMTEQITTCVCVQSVTVMIMPSHSQNQFCSEDRKGVKRGSLSRPQCSQIVCDWHSWWKITWLQLQYVVGV